MTVSGILDDIQFVIVKLKAVIQETRLISSSSRTRLSDDDDDSDDESASSRLDDMVKDQMRKSRESMDR